MKEAETPPDTPPATVGGTTTPGTPLLNLPPGVDVKSLTAADVSAIAEAGSKGGTFLCLLCQKKFGYKNGLIRHVRLTHVGEKPYECNICNRRFGYKHILMEHQNLHFGNRPYACTMCDKKFAARSNLIQHRTVHKRPFNCTLCSKRFDKEDQLKKHLFAHPQALLSCNYCQYSATSQADLSKHLTDCHHPGVLETRAKVDGGEEEAPAAQPPSVQHEESNGHVSMEHDSSLSHPNTPDSRLSQPDQDSHTTHTVEAVVHPPPPSSSAPPPQDQSPPPNLYSPRLAAAMAADHHSPKGLRVDTICRQLSSGMASLPPGMLQHMSMLPGMAEHMQQPPPGGVIVKKEVDDYDSGCGGSNPHKSPISEGSDVTPSYSSPDIQKMPAHSTPYSSSGISNISPPPPLTVSTHNSYPPPPPPQTGGAALPSIHEMFSRRPQLPPTFANFGLPAILADTRFGVPHPAEPLSLSLMSPPPVPFSSMTTSPTGVMTMTQMPRTSSGQLPPITQMLQQKTKEDQAAAAQCLTPAPGLPGLDQILNYYIDHGKLFKCQHCNILFFERGMYFLHASLHGNSDPWECSICHKVCSDKNEFTLHFVNQQHTNT